MKEKIMYQSVERLPHGKCEAGVPPYARLRARLQAGDRCQASFRQRQNFSDGVFVRAACQPVAAAFATQSLQQFFRYQCL